MKSKITLKDIAKAFSVSTSTVSRALGDSHEISALLRQKIQVYAQEHNYKPNKLALKLRSQKSLTIGVVIPKIVHYFFSTVLAGIDTYANEKGYNVMVCLSNKSYDKELASIETLLEGSVDGILISLSNGTEKLEDFSHLTKLISDGFPLVLFDCITDKIDCDKVVIDDELGAFKATEYLINSGSKRIGLISNSDFTSIAHYRTKGYIKALKKYNIKIDENLIIEIDEKEDAKTQIEELFNDSKNYPDGILALNGEMYASTAMKIAKEHDLKIPEDIGVITFTDGIISKHTSPTMTSLVQHGFEMGKQAVELLIQRIESKEKEFVYKKKVISTQLKIRNSTKNITEEV